MAIDILNTYLLHLLQAGVQAAHLSDVLCQVPVSVQLGDMDFHQYPLEMVVASSEVPAGSAHQGHSHWHL